MSGAGAARSGRGASKGSKASRGSKALKGAGKTKTGKPRPGTGGYGRHALEGKGPTPPAALRPGHPAQRRVHGVGVRVFVRPRSLIRFLPRLLLLACLLLHLRQ